VKGRDGKARGQEEGERVEDECVREGSKHKADAGKLWMMENDGLGIYAYENRHTTLHIHTFPNGKRLIQCMLAR